MHEEVHAFLATLAVGAKGMIGEAANDELAFEVGWIEASKFQKDFAEFFVGLGEGLGLGLQPSFEQCGDLVTDLVSVLSAHDARFR